MKVEIKIPAMGESISQATIGAILKESGSYVDVDDELIELETDKVNQMLYAPKAGMINWNVSKGDVVNIFQVIGTIDTDQKAKAAKPQQKTAAAEPQKQESIPAIEPSKPVPIEPSALGQKGARTTKESFLAEFMTPMPATAKQSEAPAAPKEREVRKKMSNIRKIIATRMVDVLQQTAMLTTFNEVDMSKIMSLRESYKETFTKKFDTRLGLLSFFVKAAVSGMKAFPEVNAYIDGDEIVYRQYFDIGVAVGTERGVIVPVIRGCDQLSFAELERTIEGFAKKAREGGLTADDLQGGGFTITNGGIYGSMMSTPILNPSQCAILGMHKMMKRPVVVDDQIVIRQMMYLALSYDHRILDGKEAVSFLVHIKNCLEDPSRLLLDI